MPSLTTSIPTSPLESPTAGKRHPLRAEDITPGCIIWLPSKSAIFKSNTTSTPLGEIKCIGTKRCSCSAAEAEGRNDLLPKNGYNHPAVILQMHQRPGSRERGDLECVIATISSFSSTPLPIYLTHKNLLPTSVPISHAPYHHGLSLSSPLKASAANKKSKTPSLKKQSYIRLDHVYSLPLSHLRTFTFHPKCRAYKLRISEESYAALMEVLCLPAQEWVHAGEIWETAATRLDDLVRSGGGGGGGLDGEIILRGDRVGEEEQDDVLGGVSFTGCVVDDGLSYGTIYKPPELLPPRPDKADGSFPHGWNISLGKIAASLSLAAISFLGICSWHFQFWPFHS